MNAANKLLLARLLMFLAFVFFVIDAVVTGGVVHSSVTWLLGAGLSSLTLSLLVSLFR
jgi:hypothetical protein